MFRCLPNFGNCFNYVYEQSAADGIFIFHGFPSQKNRNKDLAHFLFENTTASIFVHHYEGIGESLGQFYFEKTLSNAFRYVDKMTREFGLERIHFLGHSWGGFVSLNLLPILAADVESLVLYSPFTQIPKDVGVDELATNLMKEYPHLFFHRTFEDVCKEFRFLQQKYDYHKLLSRVHWNKPTLVLQAKNDVATPEQKTRETLPLLGSQISYHELAIDHSFTEQRSNTFTLTKDFYTKHNLAK